MIKDAPVRAEELSSHDLEIAARYAERKAQELRQEAATATTPHARESITQDALEHEQRARRYRRANNHPDTSTTYEDAKVAIETLRDYLLGTTPTNARRTLRDLRILELEILHGHSRSEVA